LNTQFPPKLESTFNNCLDTELGLSYLGGNIEIYTKMLGKFLELHLNDSAGISELLNNNNWVEAELISHSLKSISLILGMLEVNEISTKLELEIHNRLEISQITKNIQLLTVALTKVNKEIVNTLNDYVKSSENIKLK
jgi:HPt (histidine-containing phosphotransfer) domain-containing protein